jgi:hypothetical protein
VAGFEIGGDRYEVPMLDTLDLRECQILYDLTGGDGRKPIVQEDFEPAEPTWDPDRKREHVQERLRLFERPDFKRALAAIAYLRLHPEETLSDAGAMSGSANAMEFTIASILGPDEVDPTMRDSTPQESSESETQPLATRAHSGPSSAQTGTAPDESLSTTGITE